MSKTLSARLFFVLLLFGTRVFSDWLRGIPEVPVTEPPVLLTSPCSHSGGTR